MIYVVFINFPFRQYTRGNKKLGDGRAGKVYECVERSSRRTWAVKFISKSDQSMTECEREIQLLQKLRGSKNIIRLHDIYEDSRNLLLVTELCRGGELYDQIVKKSEEENNPTGGFTEYDTAVMMRQLFTAIVQCHRNRVVHRDLKPENVLLARSNDFSALRLIDFGLSRTFEPKQRLRTRVGTVYYTAPEVWAEDYDEKCDLWSLGVIMYVLICSYPPFDGDNDHEILKSVMKGRYKFHSPEYVNARLHIKN